MMDKSFPACINVMHNKREKYTKNTNTELPDCEYIF